MIAVGQKLLDCVPLSMKIPELVLTAVHFGWYCRPTEKANSYPLSFYNISFFSEPWFRIENEIYPKQNNNIFREERIFLNHSPTITT